MVLSATRAFIRRLKHASEQEIVNPISTENLQRISEQDPETILATDRFLAMLANSNSDTKVMDFLHTVSVIVTHSLVWFILKDIISQKVMELQHDFTQYYHKCS